MGKGVFLTTQPAYQFTNVSTANGSRGHRLNAERAKVCRESWHARLFRGLPTTEPWLFRAADPTLQLQRGIWRDSARSGHDIPLVLGPSEAGEPAWFYSQGRFFLSPLPSPSASPCHSHSPLRGVSLKGRWKSDINW